MEVIKDILKCAGLGGVVTLVVLGVSVRDGSVEPDGSQAPAAVDTSTADAAAQRRFAVSPGRSPEAHKVAAGSGPDGEPSDLLAAESLPRSISPLPRLSGAPYPTGGLEGEPFAASG